MRVFNAFPLFHPPRNEIGSSAHSKRYSSQLEQKTIDIQTALRSLPSTDSCEGLLYQDDTMKWEKFNLGAEIESRSRHCAAMIDEETLWIYSGQSSEYSKINRVHTINLKTMAVETVAVASKFPEPRWGHSGVYHYNYCKEVVRVKPGSPSVKGNRWIIIYGGEFQTRSLAEDLLIFSLDSSEFSHVAAEGISPGYRFCHRTVICKESNTMYLFGGKTAQTGCQFSNSLFALDLRTFRWDEVLGSGPSIPSPRAYHAMCLLDGQIYVFGGSNNKYSSDNTMYMFDLDTKRWQSLQPQFDLPLSETAANNNQGNTLDQNDNTFTKSYTYQTHCLWPMGRMNHTMTPVGSSIVMYGDKWGLGEKDQATWIFNTVTESWKCHFPRAEAGTRKTEDDDVEMEDVSNQNHDAVRYHRSSVRIEPRYGHSAEAVGSTIYYFGGYNSGFLSDVLVLHSGLNAEPSQFKKNISGMFDTDMSCTQTGFWA